MRPILPGDLDHCVRVLLAAPKETWQGLLGDLLEQAALADRFRKVQGRSHPQYGNGSLMAASHWMPKSTLPPICDKRYCAALAAVLSGIDRWRARPLSNWHSER